MTARSRKHRRVTIRDSLFRSLLLLVAFTSVTILIVQVYLSSRALDEAMTALAEEKARQVELELARFFEPPQKALLHSKGWIANSPDEHLDDPARFAALFMPVIEEYEQISSLHLARPSGWENMLLRKPDRWHVRSTRCGSSGDLSFQFHEWSFGGELTRHWSESRNYDPRETAWYQGAETVEEIHWTAPYTFKTTGDPGISLSIQFRHSGGEQRTANFDVMLRDISKFTTRSGLFALVLVLDGSHHAA